MRDGDPGVVERVPAEGGERRVVARQRGQRRVQLDQPDTADARVAQHLAQGEPVAAAEQQHPGVRSGGHRGVDERLAAPVLVGAADGAAAVQVQPQRCVRGPAVGRAGEHDLLVPGLRGEADLRAVQGVPGGPLDRAGEGRRGREDDQDEAAARPEQGAQPGGGLVAEQPEHHGGAGDGVDRPGDQRAGGLAEGGQDQEREGEAADQRADVVGGEQVGDGPPGVLPADALDQRHQERDLGADQHPDDAGQADDGGLVAAQPGPAGVQREHRQPADQRECALDQGEGGRRAAREALGEQRSEAHREDHDGEHDGGLGDRVPDQVAAERDELQLVDEAAGRADEGGEQDGRPGDSRPGPGPGAPAGGQPGLRPAGPPSGGGAAVRVLVADAVEYRLSGWTRRMVDHEQTLGDRCCGWLRPFDGQGDMPG